MEVSNQIAEIAARLSALPIKTLRLQSKHSDLEISLGESRKFIAARGCNVPSFEIFTSPDWRGTRGVYFSDLTSFRNGTYVKGVLLEFKNGRVVKASAQTGGDFLKKMISLDKGAAQIGEFSLTDRRFSRINKFMADTLFDENFGGKFGKGRPVRMDGTDGTRVAKTEEFREALEKRVNVPIVWQDERLTTVEADEILEEMGIPRSERKKYIDSIAASIILRDYMNGEKK